jgi:hypothetical protein
MTPSEPRSGISRSHIGGRTICAHDAGETRRFVCWYGEMASGSSEVLASATADIPEL